MSIAEEITAQSGADWHETQKGRQAVAAGVRHYLETMAPPVLAGKAADDLFGPDDPETLGRASARHYFQMKQYEDEDRPISSQEADRLFRRRGKR